MSIPVEVKEIVIDFVNYGLPLLAFGGSIYSVIVSRKANKMSSRVMELEKELKEFQLKNIQKEIEEAEKACVEARIIKESKNNYKLKVWNSGKATAYNVDFSTDCENDMIWRDKVPYEFLESGKSFEERVILYGGFPDKLVVKTVWKDKNGRVQSKDNLVSI